MTRLRERVSRALWETNGLSVFIDAAIDIVLEEAARVAEREGVYPELNIANGGPDWCRHGKNIAAAIRSMKNVQR